MAHAWDLVWDAPADGGPRIEDPEHHLDHYLIVRHCLDGNEPDPEPFRVKAPDVLHRENGRLKRCRSRFQFVDSFAQATDQDLASLPAAGRRYAYTVTPIDLTGRAGRPLTVVARRRPNAAPPPITTTELLVTHLIDPSLFQPPGTARPTIRRPERATFIWQAPAAPVAGPDVAVAGCRLLFRRDDVFPAGSYGLDTDAAGDRARGLRPRCPAAPHRPRRRVRSQRPGDQVRR